MPSHKPVIGLAGGIGSGKSTVARLLGSLGGLVIDADALAREALDAPHVRRQLTEWWGSEVLDADGGVDRRKLADRVFDSPQERARLEAVIHPLVGQERDRLMARAEQDPSVRFVVQDVPLLYEVGLDKQCDAVIFVDAAEQVRQKRVQATRGWSGTELARREKNQWALDRKRQLADGIINNDGDEASCMAQIRSLMKRLFPNEFN